MEQEVIVEGKVSKFEEVGEVASEEGTPNFQIFLFKAYHDKFVSPGTFVAIEFSKDKFLFGRVTGALENNPHYTAEKLSVKHALNAKPEHPDEKLSFSIFRLYEVEVTDEVHIDNGKLTMKPVETMAKAGATVVIPTTDFIYSSLGLEKDAKNGINMGWVASSISSEAKIPVILNKKIIQRHIFIGGTTGGGKSYSTRVLAEEIHLHKIPIIFFDTQDEFSSLTEKLGGKVLTPGKDYKVKLSSLSPDEVSGLIPTLKNDLHVNILINSFLTLQEKKSQFGVTDLLTEIVDTGKRLEAEKSANDFVKPRAEMQLKSYNFLGDDFDWNKILIPNSIININCKGVNRQRLQMILAATLRELQNLRKDKKILPYVLFIDEAHLFVPQDEDSACKQIIRESVRLGRHYGISLVLITQSPIDIDKKAIRQCNTRFLFAIEPDQLIALQGVKADASEDMLNKLPKSPVGTCILSGTYETVRRAVMVKIREMKTEGADGGATPDIFAEVEEYGNAGKGK